MNRHARRAAAARRSSHGEEDGPPPQYLETCSRMIDVLRAWLSDPSRERPAFALPPKDVLAIGCLDHVTPGALAKNASAEALVRRFCEIGRKIHGEGGEPTGGPSS
jgi:hypothetical protein